MTPAEIIQIITAAPASMAFAVLFNIRGKKLGAVAVGGGIGWLIYILLRHAGMDEALGYFLVATIISLYAETMARLLKAPATIFIAPSLVPFIPGASLYYTMAYALDGDTELFSERAVYTLKLAAALAIGIIVSAVIMKFIAKKLLYRKNAVEEPLEVKNDEQRNQGA